MKLKDNEIILRYVILTLLIDILFSIFSTLYVLKYIVISNIMFVNIFHVYIVLWLLLPLILIPIVYVYITIKKYINIINFSLLLQKVKAK